MLRCNVCELQKQKTNDKKVISFHLGSVFFDPPCTFFFSMYSKPQKKDNSRIRYACNQCGHVEVKSRIVVHILKKHRRKENVPYTCKPCGYLSNNLEEHHDHLKLGQHNRMVDSYERMFVGRGETFDRNLYTDWDIGQPPLPVIEGVDFVAKFRQVKRPGQPPVTMPLRMVNNNINNNNVQSVRTHPYARSSQPRTPWQTSMEYTPAHVQFRPPTSS